MRRKINLRLIGISVAVAIVTMLCMIFVFYGIFREQVRADLRTNAEVLKAVEMFDREDQQDRIDSISQLQSLSEAWGNIDLRVTWIDADGTVLFDNDANSSTLENHADRPEVQEAFASGEGETVRRSNTMGQNTFYYAILLDDGSVLRLAANASSIYNLLVNALPVMIFIVVIIILVSVLVAHLLTRQLLKPIDKLSENIEDASHVPVYKELVPFVETIREQHEDILSAAKIRQDFTASVSHELKTPLTAISGYAELIENHMVDEEQQTRFAGEIRQNADRLVTLINDIIRLSELDNGAADQPVTEQVDLYQVARDCVDMLEVSAQKQKVHLSIEGSSCIIRGNHNMIVELVDNLCQNAIRYNKENGEVRVSVKIEGDQPVLTVQDTGIGIPEEMQKRVFERFFRVDQSRSRESGGTGLGLAIVKHIVELHDAEIVLESEIGKGTTIKVIF